MKYEVTPAEKSTVKITFTFTPEEWAEANNKAYVQTRGRYAVNGFRKGKAPKHVLELYYGKGLFYEDALNLLYQEHYPKTLEKESEKFTAVDEPSLSVDDISEEKVVLSAVVPVKPDVEIETYKGIKIKKFEYTVTDADVEKEIEAMRDRVAEKVEVTDRAAQMGDTVNIDFVGKVDGKEFEGGTAHGYDLTLGSGQFIPGFEEGVVGVKIGESKDVAVKFPEDYQAEELKGKPAVFTVTVHKITGKKLPELNDEFAKKMGSETVEKYRTAVKERLEKNAQSRALNETENSILTEIAKGAKAEIPDALISRQEDSIMQRMQYNLMYQGISMDDYLKYLNTTREEYKKNFEEEARRDVLHQLIIEKIIKLENIKADQKEVDAKIAEQAKSVGKSADEYKKTVDPRQVEYIENDIIITKLFDFLMKNNEMYTEGTAAKKAPAKKPAASAEKAEKTEKPAAKKTTAKAKKED
ncbi:MAG: trigger factor [Clostridiales bacterium]|nr:trigger factor [Clostridiales bacterium]